MKNILKRTKKIQVVFTNFFKEMGAGKGNQMSATISSLRVGDELIDDSSGIANTFNDFFCNHRSKT